jgi:hypothetical protein
MALHRLTALALAGALALGVSACGGETPPETAPSTTPATASPSPTATGPAAPVLPELAKREDAVGAKAFVKFYFAAVTYAMKTGDTESLMAVSAKECNTCGNLIQRIDQIYETGGRVEGGRWAAIAFVEDPGAPKPLLRWLVQVKQAKHRILGAKSGNGPVAEKFFALRVSVVWRDERWMLQEAVDGGL